MARLRGEVNPDASGFIIKWMFPGGVRLEQNPPIRVEARAVIEIESGVYERGAAVVELDKTRGYEYHTVGLTLVPQPKDK